MRPFIKSHSSTVLNISVVLCVLALHIFVVFWLQNSLLLSASAPLENAINVSWVDPHESMGGRSIKLGAGGAGMGMPLGQAATTEALKAIGTAVIGQEVAAEPAEPVEPVFVKTDVVTQATVEPLLSQPLQEKKPSAQPNRQHKENKGNASAKNPTAPKAASRGQKQVVNKEIKALDHTVQKSNPIPNRNQQSADSAIAKPASNGEKEQALANASGTKNPSTMAGVALGAGDGQASMPGSGNSAALNGVPSGGPMHLNSSEVRFKNRVAPIYSREAQLRGYQGEVVVFIVIDQQGQVKSKRIQKTSGHRILDESALNAAQKSSYYPHIINGQAQEVQTTINYQFKLGRK